MKSIFPVATDLYLAFFPNRVGELILGNEGFLSIGFMYLT